MPRKKYYTRKKKDVPRWSVEALHDWPALIVAIVAFGYPKAQIAERLNMTRDKLYSVIEGRETLSFEQGVFVLKLAKHVKQQRAK